VAVSGRVVDAAGKPVDGALVAVIPHFELIAWDETTVPIAVTSSGGGHFRVAGVPPGRYAVTAHAPGVAGGRGGMVTIERGGAPAEVTIKIGGPGFLVNGTVTDAAGAPVGGAIIQAVRFSENEGDIYVALTDARGRYALTVPGGIPYLVVVDAPPRPRFHRQIEPAASTVDARLDPIPAPRPADDVLRSWLQANAVALATTAPGSGTNDLAPLRSMIGSARIVGLGEATHGSGEFFRMKHRLLELLVQEMGFRVFAMEAGWGDCLAIDDHVVHGNGDAADVVRRLHTHPWETEEVVDMVRWMRRYNEDPRHKEKLEFHGFDIVTGDASPALAYLKTVDPARMKENEDLLVRFNKPGGSKAWAKDGVRDSLQALAARFDAEKKTWVARTSEAAWTLARRHVEQMRIAQEIFVDQTVRDKHMAENVAYLIDTHPPGTRFVLWAHNSHIGAERIEWSDMGARLRQRWGKDYFTLGFSFDHGSFRAFERLPEGKITPWKPTSLGPAPPGTFAATLGLADKPLFLLDLRTAPPPVRDWLSGPVPSWQLGGWFMGEKQALARHPWAKSFDAVIHVREVTAAHALPEPDVAPKR
jgi:erythromycin esterase